MSDSIQVPAALLHSVRALPVLPAAVNRLLTLTQSGEVSIREIARVIESDPTLMARTLRIANSPLYTTGRAIKTAQQAAVLLGTEAIVNLALSVSVESIQDSLHEQWPIDAGAFGRHNMAVALAARKLARHFKFPHPGEAFVAGLLHDIGKLVLLMHYGEEYAALILRAQEGAQALDALERDAYGLDHALASYALCQHWNVPLSMAEAVATHHAAPAPHSLGDVVHKANNLVKTIQIGYSGNRFITDVLGRPGDLSAAGWLRALIMDLSLETRQAEEAFGGDGATYDSWKKKADRPRVQLQIADPVEQTLLTSMLLAQGAEPTDREDTALFDGPDRPVALVTDASPSERHQQAYEQLDIAVLDYAALRREQGIGDGATVDACLVGAWLSAGIAGQA